MQIKVPVFPAMTLFYVVVVTPFLLGEWIHGSWSPDLYAFLSLFLGVVAHTFIMDRVLRIHKAAVVQEMIAQAIAHGANTKKDPQ